jgi:hypothetical protein
VVRKDSQDFTRKGDVRGSDEREVVCRGEEEQAGVVRVEAHDQPLQADILPRVEDVQTTSASS